MLFTLFQDRPPFYYLNSNFYNKLRKSKITLSYMEISQNIQTDLRVMLQIILAPDI